MVVRTPDAWSGRFGMDDGYGESPGQSRSYDARKIDPVVRPRRASAIIALSRTPAPPAAAARISPMCQFVASSRRVDVILRIACRRASLRPADRIPPAPCPTGRRGYPQPRRGNCRRRGWTLWRGHPPPPSEGARSPPSSRANDNLRADTPRDFHPIDFPTDLPTRPTIPSRYPSIPHPLSSHASPRRTRLSSRNTASSPRRTPITTASCSNSRSTPIPTGG